MEAKSKAPQSEKLSKAIDAFGTILVFATIAITAIDLWAHTNHGVIGLANLERRRMLQEFFGPVIRNIGNMGFTAIMTSLAVFAKHLTLAINDSERQRPKVKATFIWILASIIALNLSIEKTLSSNPEGNNDLIGAAIALALSLGSAEFTARKIKKTVQRFKKN